MHYDPYITWSIQQYADAIETVITGHVISVFQSAYCKYDCATLIMELFSPSPSAGHDRWPDGAHYHI